MCARISTGRDEIGEGGGDKGGGIDICLGGVKLDGSATMTWNGIGCEGT
jgi:hypothetical protein